MTDNIAAASSTQQQEQEKVPEQPTVAPSTSAHWWSSTCWVVAQRLWKAWKWFDVNVGWFVGLDEPKYKWAVLEYERRKREEDDAIMNGEAALSKGAQDDEMEGAPSENSAPVQEVMVCRHAPQRDSHVPQDAALETKEVASRPEEDGGNAEAVAAGCLGVVGSREGVQLNQG